MISTLRGILFLFVALTMTIIGVFRIDRTSIALGTTGLLLTLIVIMFGKSNLRGIDLKIFAPSRLLADTPFICGSPN